MDLGDLTHFLALARYGRLSAAGERLGVERTTIRRRVTSLEASMGARLFDKTSAGWTLTPAGQRLLPFATRIEQEADAAQAALGDSGHHLKGTVRIIATEGLGGVIIPSAVAAIQRQHPALEVDLVTTSNLLNYAVGEFDIAVTIGDLPQRRDFRQSHLCDYELRLYAARSYLDAHPPLASAADLPHHKMIWFIDSLMQLPEVRDRENHEVVDQVNIQFRTTNLFAQLEATVAGVGLGLLPCFLAHHDPRLVPILHDEVSARQSYWMVVPSRLLNLELTNLVIGHLRTAVQLQSQRLIPV